MVDRFGPDGMDEGKVVCHRAGPWQQLTDALAALTVAGELEHRWCDRKTGLRGGHNFRDGEPSAEPAVGWRIKDSHCSLGVLGVMFTEPTKNI